MAAMTTASLASLLDLESESSEDQSPNRLIEFLGLDSKTTVLNVIGLLTTAFFSISFLVFLNSAQSFVLTSLLNIPLQEVGQKTGTLLFADEILSLIMVVVYGVGCDLYGVRTIATIGHAWVALGFIMFVNATSFKLLIGARLIYALGASSLVTSLTAGLALFTPAPASGIEGETKIETEASRIASSNREGGREGSRDLESTREGLEATERTNLLPSNEEIKSQSHNKNGTFVGIIGAVAGCGALLAVFGYLRLPNLFSSLLESYYHYSFDESSRLGLKYTFYFIASLAILIGTFLFFALKMNKPALPPLALEGIENVGENGLTAEQRLQEVVNDMGIGFILASKDLELALAFATGFVTRAQSVIVSSFVPLLINNFFIEHDLCNVTITASSQSCRQAFVLSSQITGIIQLLSLLFCPVLGWLSTLLPPALILSISVSLGGLSFLGFSLLPNGDPRSKLVFIYGIGMGISQAAGLVLSLSLVATARGKIVQKEGREVGGAISGAYSFCGGFGILFLGKLSGSLFDKFAGAPFLLISISDALVAAFAIYCYCRK